MAVITHAQIKTKLSSVIDRPGGISVGVALSRARANIESRRSQATAVLEIEISGLEGVAAPTTLEDQAFRLQEAYRAANGVIDAASPFGLADLCRAASGLCDMIDSARPDLMFDWRVVTVYARALRLLQTLPLDQAETRSTVLDSLMLVADRKLQPPGP